jgi:hypothetical protein
MARDEYLSIEEGGWVRWIRTGYGLPTAVRIRYSPDERGRLVAREVQIVDEDGIRTEWLREVPLGRLETWANRADVAELVLQGAGVDATRPRTGPRVPIPARKGRASYPDGFYQRVADAVTAGHPARAIADASGVPLSTVNRWIKGARERGFLAPSRRGGGD